MDKEKAQLLEEAIHRFNATSSELEKSYRLLESQVRQLKQELEIKNQALKESTEEKERLREQAERNLRLAAVGEMSARMAHELRNPLGSIELFASLLKKGLSSDTEKAGWAQHIQTAVEAMDYALSNLLAFTGKPKANLKKTDIKKVIKEALGFATHLIQQKEIQAVTEIASLTKAIPCDEDLLRQVFLNLILNAIDAMGKGGTLTIEAEMEKDPDVVKIRFRDTGCGIPEDCLPRVFDPFYTTKNKGTGLGLAIVHNAIVAHQGTIEVESRVDEEKKGHGGTCFTMILPIRSEKGTTTVGEQLLPGTLASLGE